MSDSVAIPQPGQPALASWGADVARAIRSMRLSGGPGIRVTPSPSGTTISAIPQPRRASGIEIDVIVVARTGDPTFRIVDYTDGSRGLEARVRRIRVQEVLPITGAAPEFVKVIDVLKCAGAEDA